MRLDALVQRTEGMTPAAIEKIVDTAALSVFREATADRQTARARTPQLLAAIERYGGPGPPDRQQRPWERT